MFALLLPLGPACRGGADPLSEVQKPLLAHAQGQTEEGKAKEEMKEPKTRTFTQVEFIRELQRAGFLAAWKFWQVVKDHSDNPAYARGVLQGMGVMILKDSELNFTSLELEALKELGVRYELIAPPGPSSGI